MLCLPGVLPNGQSLTVMCKCKVLMACLPLYFWDLKESGWDKTRVLIFIVLPLKLEAMCTAALVLNLLLQIIYSFFI